MPEEAQNTGSAEAGAISAGGGEAAPKPAVFDETTIPQDVLQKHIQRGIDIGYGRAREKAEKEFQPYREVAEIFLMDELDEETKARILEHSPAFKKWLTEIQGARQQAAAEGDTETLKRLEALEKQFQTSQQSAITSSLDKRIKDLSGGDSVKEKLLRSTVVAAVEQYGPADTQKRMEFLSTWSDEHWGKIDQYVDGELKKRDEASKQGYIQGKREGATKGAEGAGGTTPSPEKKPEYNPDLGMTEDTDFRKEATAALEGI